MVGWGADTGRGGALVTGMDHAHQAQRPPAGPRMGAGLVVMATTVPGSTAPARRPGPCRSQSLTAARSPPSRRARRRSRRSREARGLMTARRCREGGMPAPMETTATGSGRVGGKNEREREGDRETRGHEWCETRITETPTGHRSSGEGGSGVSRGTGATAISKRIAA